LLFIKPRSEATNYCEINLEFIKTKDELISITNEISRLVKTTHSLQSQKYIKFKSLNLRKFMDSLMYGLILKEKLLNSYLSLGEKRLENLLKEYFKRNQNHLLFVTQILKNQLIIMTFNKTKAGISILPIDFLKICDNLIVTINKINQKIPSSEREKLIKELATFSEEFNKSFPQNIRNFLDESQCIIISSCSRSQLIPFDFIKTNDGLELGLSKLVSRIFSVAHYLSDSLQSEVSTKCISKKSLLVIDPVTSEEEIPKAKDEGEYVCKILESKNFDNTILYRKDANQKNLSKKLNRELSLLHFAAHGNIHEILLSNETKFNLDFLRKNLVWFDCKPFIFLNTCSSGLSTYFGGGRFIGLIPELMRSNSGSIIASTNLIYDDFSLNFSKKIYDLIQTNDNIGSIFLKTRNEFKDTIFWINYKLYGNPNQIIIS